MKRKVLTVVGLMALLSGIAPGLSLASPDVPPTESVLQEQRDRAVTIPIGTEEAAIAKVQAAGLMTPYVDGQFHPEQAITRAELASVLVKTFKLNERQAVKPVSISLRDVKPTYWAADEIQTVVNLGIMSGYRQGYFYPTHRITRAEALAILAQAYGVQQFDNATVDTILSRYSDANQVPVWSRKALATSLKNGFVDAADTGKILPLKPMTRGDMAFAINQYLIQLESSELRPQE